MSDSTRWHRSSFCSDGACAEIQIEGDIVRVRSTRQPGTTVEFTLAEWEALRAAIKNNEF